MRQCLQEVATGPELSKSISREAARAAMQGILDGRVDPIQAGIYLIALRMKRETDEENLGTLDALLEGREEVPVNCEQLADIADPFNGYARNIPATPFLPALLAACGLPACANGLRDVGPKYGLTHHRVLEAAGIAVNLSPREAAATIEDDAVGWAYLDQAQSHPALHALVDLRAAMVKRSCLTTLEVVLGPLRARKTTQLVTGYVHKPYPPVYGMIARAAGYDRAVVIRGVEGGCVPSLSQPSRLFRYDDSDSDGSEQRLDPSAAQIEQVSRSIAVPDQLAGESPLFEGSGAQGIYSPIALGPAARHCLDLGEAALAGEPGAMADSLTYVAAICLWQAGRADSLAAGADEARKALAGGEARRRFDALRR